MADPAVVLDYISVFLDFLKALLWPAVVVIFLLAFREPLSQLIGRIREASGFGVTAKLDPAAGQLAEATASLTETRRTQSPALDGRAEEADFDSGVYPLGVGRVVYSWTNLQSQCQEFVRTNGLSTHLTRQVPETFSWLVANGLAPDGVAEVARDLRDIRNKVVHSPSVRMLSPSGVDDFVKSVARLSDVLTDAAKQLTLRRAHGQDFEQREPQANM